MSIRIIYVFVLSLFFIGVEAQNGLVRGNVYDKDNGEPIIYGNVYLEGTTLGSTTDLDGFFTISDIEPGDYTLISTYIGYDTARVDIKISPNDVEYQSLYLSQSGVSLGVVNVSAKKEAARSEVQISELKVSKREIEALPSVGGEPDVVQYLQVLPGVISTGDQGGQLYIRGGSPVQNKILLDGLTLYNPFHSIGFFSVFETDIINNVDVLTGGFNAEYGGRISAIVDIDTREGSRDQLDGFISGSPFIAKALVEGPLKKFKEGEGSSSFILSAKKSLTEYTTENLYSYAAANDSIGLPFTFQDFYGKLSFMSGNGSKFEFFGFNFDDGYNNPAVANIGWQNVGGGAKFRMLPTGSDMVVGGSFGYTDYGIQFEQEDSDERSSEIRELHANLDFTFYGNNNEIKYGFDLRSIRTDFTFTNPFDNILSQTQNTTELSGFFKYRQVIAGKLILEPSIRLMYYASPGLFSPEPRLGLKFNVTDKFRLKAAGGLYSQNVLSTSNERDVVNLFSGFLSGPENRVLDINGEEITNILQRSRHLIAGFEYDLLEGMTINIEGYYKDFPQLLVVNRNKLDFSDPDYIAETGEAYGIDFSVKYELPKLYLWATYSHGYVNRNDGEQVYPTVFDRRHNINALASYSIDEAGTWKTSIRWNFGSGFPFTKTQGFYNRQQFDNGVGREYLTDNPDNIGIIYSSDRNGGRLPYYHRLDVSLSKSIELTEGIGLELTASVTNAYDRNNIFYFDRLEYERVDQLPIIPTLTAKLDF